MADEKRRRPMGALETAQAVFKPAAPKGPDPEKRPPVIPGAREVVSLRIDKAVLAHFQEEGPGWQDRINEALLKTIGL